MNTKQLLKLADFLDTLPRQKFDFAVVAHQHGKPMRAALKAGKTACGTVACALGWTPAVWPRALRWHPHKSIVLEIRFKDGMQLSTFDTAALWFDITREATEYLFDPSVNSLWRATPKRVARHIRRWVRKQQKAAAA